ncbi:MAG: hypothetical protein RLZZ630_648 [Bacteroidota bacterium]|jgi:superfamily I DNA/RNA helicase
MPITLTSEQEAIVSSSGNLRIQAVAGAGKTSTLIAYAKAQPKSKRILYLAFNRSVRLEAINKFANQGLDNVEVETAHSLAFRYIVRREGYKVRLQGYKIHELVEVLGLKGNGEKHNEFILANHIGKLISLFCNSDKARVQEVDYREVVADKEAKRFVAANYHILERQTRLLLSRMDKGEIDITHDFYLKKFQLEQPELHYDIILFDEGQDASAAMLDVFFRQRATKVIVGDTHQQIYGWRYAVNSLEKADYTTYQLSNSFRFGQDIANLAVEVLQRKKAIGIQPDIRILGSGEAGKGASRAVIARTNLGLLVKAIETVIEKNQVDKIYFEGNFNSYTVSGEGASLFDVLNLSNGRKRQVRDPLIRQMRDVDELEDYVKKTGDVQLGIMVEVVNKYGNRLPSIIKKLRDYQVLNDEKEKAGLIFSTVHRCKGMEYDAVELTNDFMTQRELEQVFKESGEDELMRARLNEEINLLYVACTRTRGMLSIPKALLPEEFPPSPNIQIIDPEADEEEDETPQPQGRKRELRQKQQLPKSYSVEELRTRHHGAYSPWTPELDQELTVMYCEGVKLRELASRFGRTQGAIRSRIKKLELEELYG